MSIRRARAEHVELRPCTYLLALAIKIQAHHEREWPALVEAIPDEAAKGPVWAWLRNHGRGVYARGLRDSRHG